MMYFYITYNTPEIPLIHIVLSIRFKALKMDTFLCNPNWSTKTSSADQLFLRATLYLTSLIR